MFLTKDAKHLNLRNFLFLFHPGSAGGTPGDLGKASGEEAQSLASLLEEEIGSPWQSGCLTPPPWVLPLGGKSSCAW